MDRYINQLKTTCKSDNAVKNNIDSKMTDNSLHELGQYSLTDELYSWSKVFKIPDAFITQSTFIPQS